MRARILVIVPIALLGLATAACSPEADKADQPEPSDRLESPDPPDPADSADSADVDSGEPEPDDTGGDAEEEPEDLDGDGHLSDVDCDDTSAEVHPGAAEVCNGVDDDCNGSVDGEGAEGCTDYWVDLDGDGYGSREREPRCLCEPYGQWTAPNDEDCDDETAATYSARPAAWTSSTWSDSVAPEDIAIPIRNDGSGGWQMSLTAGPDVDGNGTSDLAISAPGWTDGGCGEVALVLQMPTGSGWYDSTTVAHARLLGSSAQRVVAGALVEDIDGDTSADLLLTTQDATEQAGLFWTTADLGAGPHSIDDLGTELVMPVALSEPAVAVTATSDGDAVVVAWSTEGGAVWTPSAGTTGTTVGGSGRSVWSAGDTNGDGLGDLVLTDSTVDSGRGSATLWLATGSPPTDIDGEGTQLVEPTTAALSSAGSLAGALRDINGDGYEEWFVGASSDDTVVDNGGCVYVFLGDSAAPWATLSDADLVLYGGESEGKAGRSPITSSDVDGDGQRDIIGTVHGESWASSEYSITKAPSLRVLLAPTLSGTALLTGDQDFKIEGFTEGGEGLGESAVGGVDLDGNGEDDFVFNGNWCDVGYCGLTYLLPAGGR